MLRTYQGYFNNGQFIPLDTVSIPNNRRVILTVLDDEIIDIHKSNDSVVKKQQAAFEDYFKAIDAIEGEEFTEADFSELENNRLCFGRTLDL